MSVASDAELLGASSGDPDAFATLVERHHRALFRYIAWRLGLADAEDIVNEVFLMAFTARGRYDEDRPDARPWLFGIATNLIRRHVRRETRALRAFAASGRDPIAPHAHESEPGIGADLAGALAAIRPKHRDVLFLYAVAELTLDEIAVALDVPIGTVKSWLHRARAGAAKALRPGRRRRNPYRAGGDRAMTTIDELVKEFRCYVSDPHADAAARTARHVAERAATPGGRARTGTIRRRALTLAGTAAGLGLGAVVAILVLAADKSTRTASPAVDWGIEAVIRVEPDVGGLDPAAATDRAVRILRGRWGDRGIDVAPLSPGRVRLTAPAARRDLHVARLIASPDYRVYDIGPPLLDTRDPVEAARWLRDNANPSAPPSGYAAIPTRPDECAIGTVARTRAEASRFGPPHWTVVAIPAGVLLLATPSPPGSRYLALRDEPLVRAEEIEGATDATDTTFRLEMSHAARDRLRALPGPRTGNNLLLAGSESSPIGTGTSSDVSEDGVVVATSFDFTASYAHTQLAGGAMSGRFTIESTTAFGGVPPLVGRRPAALPHDVLRTLPAASTAMYPPGGARPDIPRDAVLEVVAAEALGIEWRAYAARAPWDEDLYWLIGTRTGANGERLQVVSAVGGACEVEPLNPVISSCTTPGGSDWVASLGRLSPDVVRVEAILADGSATGAVVENDWWLLALDARTARTLLEVRALDANGDVVGRLSPRDAAIATAPPAPPAPLDPAAPGTSTV